MKKIIVLAIVIAGLTIFNGCNKNEQNEINGNDLHSLTPDYVLPSNLTTGVVFEDGLLKFDDQATFDRILLGLENENEKWNQNFFNKYEELNDDKIEKRIIEEGFNEYEVFMAFENYYCFSSLRERINYKETIWLNNEEPDFDNNPGNHQIIDDETRTLFNENCEVMIGNSIYKLIPENGLVYEVVDGDFTTLNQIRKSDNSKLKSGQIAFENVIIHNKEPVLKSASGLFDKCEANIRRYGEYK